MKGDLNEGFSTAATIAALVPEAYTMAGLGCLRTPGLGGVFIAEMRKKASHSV